MKKIFNLFFNQFFGVVVLTMMVGTAIGQNVTITYTSGSFNGENGWVLMDCTQMPPAPVLCDAQAAVPGTYTASVNSGADLKLFAYETFGDGWNGATISMDIDSDYTDVIAGGGCTEGGGAVISGVGGNDAADDNGFVSCPPTDAQLAAGNLIANVVMGCSTCDIVCPENIVVANTTGLCGAIVECPLPTYDPAGCVLVGEVNPITVDQTVAFALIPGFPNGGNSNPGQYEGVVSLAPLCDNPMPTACVDEICIDITIGGDLDFGLAERVIITSPQFPGWVFNSDLNGYLQCSDPVETFCFDAAGWDALRADCEIVFDIDASTATGVNTTLCGDLDGINVSATMATGCDEFSATVTFPDGSIGLKVDEFPVGTSCITYSALGGTPIPGTGGTGSGTGSGTTVILPVEYGEPGIPIECTFKITVEDREAPVFVCPEDRTFNLQSGECCEIVDYDVFATDNCGLAVAGVESSPAQFEGCDPAGAGGSTFDMLYFDIENNSDCNAIFLETINIPVWGALASGTFAWEVYTIPGTSVGNETNAAAWTLAGSLPEADYVGGDVASVPLNGAEMIGCEGGFILQPGESIGVAAGFPVQYTNAFGIEYVFGACTPPANADGLNLVSNGATTTAFAGTLLTPRGFVGDFNYSVLDLCAAGGNISDVVQVSGLPTGSAYSVGTYPHVYSAEDCAGNVSTCEFELVVNDIPNVTSNLTCDDHVNVSVDENCQVLVTADMFLEGGPYSCLYDCYEVYLKDEHGHVISPACLDQLKPEVDASDVSANDVNGCTIALECGTYTYEVYDACRDNTCWGTFLVEDKTAPTIVPPADVTITCMQDPVPSEDCFGSLEVEIPADVTIGTAAVTVATTATVSGIPAAAVVTNVTLDVEMSHTWVNDLSMTLTSPNGAVVTLLNQPCPGTLDNNFIVTFDDTNGGAITCGASGDIMANCETPTSTAFSGIIASDSGDLGTAINGSQVSGDWTLTIIDAFGGDGGCLNLANLNIDYVIAGVEGATLEGGCNDDLTYIDDEFKSDCDGGFIIRTWVATDDKGNQSTYDQRIDIIQVGAEGLGADWFWPRPVVDLNCGVDSSPEGIYDYYTSQFEALNPCPTPESCDDDNDPWVKARHTAGIIMSMPNFLCDKDGNLGSFRENTCNMIFDYSDQVLNACGTDCPGNAKIIRTWTGLDWCTAETIDFVQIIHAKDTEAPVIDMRVPAITAGYNPWGCLATVALPAPEHLTDNCSPTVEYTVSGPGVVSYNPVEGGVGTWVASGIGKGNHTYTYTASDCCGNESTTTVVVTVVDNSPPVPVAIENIVVGLTFSPTNPEAGSAKVFVDMIDNGSHDGSCGLVRKAIRRIDDEACGNSGNSTFFNFNDLPPNQQPEDHDRNDPDGGQFVKFCCNDLINGDGEDLDGDGVNDYVNIMVELGVWDDADCDGWPGSTTNDRFARTWANVRLEAKVNPVLDCPPNAMITCDLDETSELVINTRLGRATASTACGPLDVKYTDVCDWDQNADGDLKDDFTMMGETVNEKFNKACHYGPIVRTWSIPGTNRTCEQIVIVKEPTSLFSGSYYLTDVNGDYILNGTRPIENDNVTFPYEGDAVDIEDDNFDDYSEVALECVDDLGNEEPTWVTEHCSLIGWSLDSDTLDFEGDACRKIINKYCVIDWCQYDPNGLPLVADNGDLKQTAEAPGKWCWTVIGKLVDTTAPVIEAETGICFPANPTAGGSGGFPTTNACVTTSAEMTAIGTDGDMSVDGTASCPSSWLKWVVLVDAYNDWTYDFEWNSFIPEDNPNSIPCGTDSGGYVDNNGNGVPDVRVGSGKCDFDSADDFATAPGEAYTIYISEALAAVGIQLEADCGATQHRVEWTVYDGCGNLSSTTTYFTVEDKKAPTPYCINLSTALMDIPVGGGPEDAMVELWAIDFDAGSFDNCTTDDELLYTFTDDPSTVIPEYRSAAMRFTCDDLAGGNPALLTIPVYVWDGCGNRDFCLVNLRLVDNNDNCGTPSTGSDIAGVVVTEAGQTVENVDVMNQEVSNALEMHEMTDQTGHFMFAANDLGMDYQLTGEKNDDYLNGISTIDLVMIQRHILGIQALDSPYKLIAADVNNDNVIDGRDLVELRKLILGIYTELPQNDSWRFGDANQTLDINNPWSFDESIEVANLDADKMTEDFIGVKIGDVSGDVVANLNTPTVGAVSNGGITIDFQDMQVEAGQTVEIAVSANLSDVYGYQFTLATPGLQLVGINSGSLNVTEANFGVFGDVVTTSYNDSRAISTSDKLFTMTFKSAVAGQLSEILDLNSDITKAEAYVGSNYDVVDVNLNNTTAVQEFALEQNEPNPFSATTVIGFQMAETADATMTVYDVTGKVISVINGNYTKGYNEIELSKSDLGVSGVLYYQFDSGDFTATKKMIIIE